MSSVWRPRLSRQHTHWKAQFCPLSRPASIEPSLQEMKGRPPGPISLQWETSRSVLMRSLNGIKLLNMIGCSLSVQVWQSVASFYIFFTVLLGGVYCFRSRLSNLLSLHQRPEFRSNQDEWCGRKPCSHTRRSNRGQKWTMHHFYVHSKCGCPSRI